jgi:REP element-mobilizing transposase RayT
MTPYYERKSMRLPEFDYSMPGAYFVTTCTKGREFLFETPDAKLAVESAWQSLLDIFNNIELGEFVVMPNHIHGIVWITGNGSFRLHPGTWKNDFDGQRRGGQLPTSTLENTKFETLSNIVGAFKTTAATRINKLRGSIGLPVWQKSFYDRIVRNEHELEQIHKYIQHNPIKWEEDRDNPASPRFQAPVKSIDDYWDEIFDVHL